jgi:hypothetical protein
VTKEDIIKMARECGIPSSELYHANLERFAAIVMASEREVCIADIQLCIPRSGNSTPEIVFAKKAIDRIRERSNT